jgi:DtxR family Mn-dependent transcriptional regulator
MTQPYTQTTQDCLKYIYELTEGGVSASTSDISSRLGITPASVTGLLQKLSALDPPLVDYRKYQGATLTPTGKLAALEVIRHHRLLETWLVKTLGYTWDEVHEEACRLEHAISEEFEARIADALGNPTRDPHGDPIPGADLQMPEGDRTTLSSLRPHQMATITRVNASDPALFRHLDELGIVPGVIIEVRAHSPFDGNITILLDERQAILGNSITEDIFVEVL